MNATTAQQFDRAFAAHRAGQVAVAAEGYRAVLKIQPQHFDALHMLGVALLQSGDHAGAARSIEQAVALRPGVAMAWQNLAAAYRGLGRHADAADSLQRTISLTGEEAPLLEALADLNLAASRYDQAESACRRWLALAPQDAAALVGLAIALRELGKPEQALPLLEQALQIDPGQARAATNLGITLHVLHRRDEALACYDRQLALTPEHAPAHNARALTLWQLGRLDDALQAYEAALALDARYVDAYVNRGALRATLGQSTEAENDYRQAIALDASRADAYNGLGALSAGQRRFDAAVDHYRRAVSLQPQFAKAHNNLGVALVEMGRASEALASYGRAIELQTIDPAAAAAALANRSAVWARLRRYGQAAADARAAWALNADEPDVLGNAHFWELMQADWRHHAPTVQQLTEELTRGRPVATPFAALTAIDDPALLLGCARRHAARQPRPSDQPRVEHAAHPRIRLAWCSSDLHEHATAQLLAGVLEQLDPTRFELIALSYGPQTGDRYQRRLQERFDRWIDVRDQGDEAVADLIRELRIDIAIDLKGYTHEGRPGIFAWRSAPVQLSYLGFPGTSGMAHIDYLIADAITVPPDLELHYSEQIVRLPDSYQPNDATRAITDRPVSRRELGLPDEAFVFCSFNNGYKITPTVFDVWMGLLRELPNSVLWLLQDNAELVSNLRREAQARGIAGERLVFAERVTTDEHLARHAAADLFLDTWPVNAHTTASDALWAGLPLITLPGRGFAARVAASLLHAAGLRDCAASDSAHYTRLAVSLARDPEALAALRQRVRAARYSALFDTVTYTRQLEAAFVYMHDRARAGLPPLALDVPRAGQPR